MASMQHWPELVTPVQAISEAGIEKIPDRYIKPVNERPLNAKQAVKGMDHAKLARIPVVDLQGLSSSNLATYQATVEAISTACREWGFFQVVNHGVSLDLVNNVKDSWRGFFCLPTEKKQVYANSPITYEGYGSRLGVEKSAILDWGDYFFLSLLPVHKRTCYGKWPVEPISCRETTEEYSAELLKLCKTLMMALSMALGLEADKLLEEFGARDDIDVGFRVNYYPKCPEPDLTLGLSSHSDPGGLTVLLADEHVAGLQVNKEGEWLMVKPAPNAFIINIGDQIQVLSNGIFKSVEHRVVVNAKQDRLSLALFYNPRSDVPLGPLPALLSPESPPLYQPMTFNVLRYLEDRIDIFCFRGSQNQSLTNFLLDGTNYLPWARAIKVAIGGRLKLEHILGASYAIDTGDVNAKQIPAATPADPKATDTTTDSTVAVKVTTPSPEWVANDLCVMSWIFNSMEPKIYNIFAYSNTAKELWDSLFEMYGNTNNSSRVFEIQRSISALRQEPGQTLLEHLSNHKQQWEELRQFRPVADTVQEYIRREQQDQILSLLGSLSSEFDETRRDILLRPELPSLTTVCSILQSEETRKRVMGTKVHNLPPSNDNYAHLSSGNSSDNSHASKGGNKKGSKFYCDYCKKPGHSKDRCWNLYPHLKPAKMRTTEAHVAVTTDDHAVQGKIEQLSKQMEFLMSHYNPGKAPAAGENSNSMNHAVSNSVHHLESNLPGQNFREDDW
ncbi:hypothetical protein LUZ61_012995 [Rhynchospora tenuis]|uniref:Fe2OG dioxygenase domain-containing protein n=1 Tax=Rhynchospora tenuis TaxID=198213 RepID=A0AAD6A461_9POAL|nr:hypothetical protein LUZ61_012995 [Rhynchospora tenuis]